MTCLNCRGRAEILGGLADVGEEVLHVFPEADPDVLRERLRARTPVPCDPGTGQRSSNGP